jgi:DNA-binding MarR family transcriptional regulator
MSTYNMNLAFNIMDALECAKEAYALLPPLPPNMKPVHFRILNTIYRIRDESGNSRVSDINRSLGFFLPNTTHYINELVELNIVKKFTPDTDKRVVLVRTTQMGEQYINKYVCRVNNDLKKEFLKINETDCLVMIETIQKVYQAMKKVYQEINN